MGILDFIRKNSYKQVKKKFEKHSFKLGGVSKSKKYLIDLCTKYPLHEISYKRAFFTVYKDISPELAVIFGDEVVNTEHDPAFIRVLATRHKRLGNIERAKELLDSINDQEHVIDKITLHGTATLLDSCSTELQMRKAIEELILNFPEKENTIYKYVFSHLKDTHTLLSISYGKKYTKQVPDDSKFMKALLKRIYQLNLEEDALEVESFKDDTKYLKKLKRGKMFQEEILLHNELVKNLKIIAKKLDDSLLKEYIEYTLTSFKDKEKEIFKIVFITLKNTNMDIALHYGKKYLKSNPADAKFGRSYKHVKKEYTALLETSQEHEKEKTYINHLMQSKLFFNKKLDLKIYKEKLLAASEVLSEEKLKELIDIFLNQFPEQETKIEETTFSVLKDSHTSLSISYGKLYHEKHPENHKFAKVLIKRKERLGLTQGMIKIAKNTLQYCTDDDLQYLIFQNELNDYLQQCEMLYMSDEHEQLSYELEQLEERYKDHQAMLYRALFKFYKHKSYTRAEVYAQKSLVLKYNEHLIKDLYDLHITYGHFDKGLLVLPEECSLPTLKIKKDNGQSLLDLYQNGFDLPIKKVSNYIAEEKKVLYLLHNRLPYNSGGYATRSHGLLTGVSKYGWTINGVSRLGYPLDKMPDKKSTPLDIIEDISYHRLLQDNIGLGKLPLKSYLEAYAKSLLELSQKEKPAIIHAASNFMNGVVGNYVAKCLGIKSVYEVRGLWEITRISRQPNWKDTPYYQLMVKMEAEAAKGADIVFTLTEALKEEMISRGVSKDKIFLLPNGVISSRFVPHPKDEALAKELNLENKIVIGFIGSFVQYEGLEYLVDAVKILIDKGIKNIGVLMVGDGAVWEDTKNHVEDLKIEEYFKFTGRVPHEEVEKYYSLVDIAPFPRKGLPVCEMVSPLKPFEAMAMEKAVVSSNVAALAEIVQDNYNGVLFEKDNIEDLADKLEILIHNENLRNMLGKQSREWVIKERDWNVISEKLHTAYETLTGENNKKSF